MAGKPVTMGLPGLIPVSNIARGLTALNCGKLHGMHSYGPRWAGFRAPRRHPGGHLRSACGSSDAVPPRPGPAEIRGPRPSAHQRVKAWWSSLRQSPCSRGSLAILSRPVCWVRRRRSDERIHEGRDVVFVVVGRQRHSQAPGAGAAHDSDGSKSVQRSGQPVTLASQ